MSRVPLSVLDLSPFGSGQTPADGLRASIGLARAAERLGYRRYWVAEHHFNPGIAGAAPHVLLASVAAVTHSIRIGTAATIIGNYSPAQVAEAAGVVAQLHPGRFDLGIGRSGSRSAAAAALPAAPEDRVVDGLLLPAARPFAGFDSERFVVQARLLGRTEADAERFADEVADILSFFDGTFSPPEDVPIHVTPAERADVTVWIHGSTAGPSARLAGELGLPFGANYHVAPGFVLEAIAEYRAAFRPGRIAEPYVIVSVDAVVAETDAAARRIAAGYGRWVHSIRAGHGAVPFPSPDEAAADPLTAEELAVVRDRLDTQFVGSPETVVERLETLQRVTGADELLVTTVTHDPVDRVRSYELLAEAWDAEPDASAGSAASVSSEWTIRLVRTEEYERAGDVTAQAYLSSYDKLSDEYVASLRDVAGRVREGDVWVAVEPDGEILGTVWVARPNRPLAEVARPGETDFRQLAVAPAARGRGIGEALTRHVIDLARERGSHRVVMNSGPEMTGAHALYAKLGFRRLSEREGLWEVQPGRWIELYTFGYDLAPEPADASPGERAWTFETVPWDDPRAEELRAEMDVEVSPRYADRLTDAAPAAAEEAQRTFAVDPDTIVATVLAVDAAGDAVGHAALRDLAHDGTRDLEVKRVFVKPRARGTGASRALMRELERIAQDRGAGRLILQTGDRQHDAVVLYERIGYRPIPIFEPYTAFAFSQCFAKELAAPV
ncbi:alkanesulfonate monooxygenase SsuD/methylene tetrahydromethanopterin reductase-like flavin-dependent oxidoreductase (luciferase family)/GNAT superfamily N-acetyltransferase [Microbacterium trichothecenolyticum]|uniref:LLM class flavin-dependent oxidoreductase n=1 Tax=Microbacterium trichothecenolyticum TaxID=69370 RepID=UPI00286773BD|nr:LLM class flavin-dependent oxidoreductase [Microbacterium trichothecenolyticum]MDR7110576.1 alkanesulfonate monooxygenase SsuD/methylene tetrahydromethanopterin reductase-like flavin-dependent oxidoreductase (luciferase family)/GNAT superfamily N-acetyltransferase [Microbacterium trichothecenolyticum]